ncbi:S9 family peptidase [Sphingopyxis granuli]|uniref:Peptidase S9, prolyl oligopeptidase active site region n=1 Tax=Sphingopyxis granuli TaxID=267128 RepID=A0AA86L5K1_9SPHN|nr:S9 family peptidase [Sphingopyxis granuli]AMG75940.1 peptidase S9, prolyl oligopeptidase active site region [Sphingopyxis granuli]
MTYFTTRRSTLALAIALVAPGLSAGAILANPAIAASASAPAASSETANVQINDLFALRRASDPQLSPDGTRVIFSVSQPVALGVPQSLIWIGDVAARTAKPWGGGEGVRGGSARWSPDGTRIAYRGRSGDKSGILVANADGSNPQMIAELRGTNELLPGSDDDFLWSPDGKRIAFVSAVDGPEPSMDGDPMVITRYGYRPMNGYPKRFVDNRRLHLFVVDVASRDVKQITHGLRSEHSIDWSPDGRKLAFLSNYEPDPDMTFNYDISVVDVDSGAITRVTETKSAEYAPRWSPDGKTIAFLGLKRDKTSSETNMEDTHVWTIDVASGQRRELGAVIDNRQSRAAWSPDGRWIYFTVQARGNVGLYRLPAAGGGVERVGPPATMRADVGGFSLQKNGTIVAALATPGNLAELYTLKPNRTDPPVAITSLNANILAKRAVGEVSAFTFRSFDGREVEAFLTKPVGLDPWAAKKYPLIVMIHGGPHGQQGPTFNHKAQVYAARGWAALMVNYRGSTGYGQGFSDAITRDQNGGEAKDILAGLDAASAQNPWIDTDRLGIEGGSYGGQLTNWLITQTPRFKAAIPWAGISNLVSFNYTSSYHDYLEQEYGGKPHVDGIMDMLWERSPIRYVQNVKTPVMFGHGDRDFDVDPSEDDQFFIALRDVGVEAMMLRYPREGHGMRETQHIADFLQRSIDWYETHFSSEPRTTTVNTRMK